MVLRSRDGSNAKVGSLRCTRQVILLLFGTAPQFPAERYPCRIERHHSTVTQFHHCHTMVEMIGRNRFYPASSHCHCRKGFKSGHPQECNQCSCNILTYSTTVCIIHFQVMQCKSFSFSHGNTCIPDVISHPVSQYRNLFQFGFLSPDQFIHLFLSFRYSRETAIVFIDSIKPAGLFFPVRSCRHHQFRSSII